MNLPKILMNTDVKITKNKNKTNTINSQYKYLELMGIDVWLSQKPAEKIDINSNSDAISSVNNLIDINDVNNVINANNNSCVNCKNSSKHLENIENTRNTNTTSINTNIANTNINMDKLDLLQQQVMQCQLCALSKTRNNVVFGTGNINAKIMFIGEAPGANEDLQGKPFVGRAGMLLNAMLEAVKIKRQDVYIANILKCRPPNNRDPNQEEIAVCTPYLQQQITLINPQIIIAVGRVSALHLLQTDTSMSNLREKTHSYTNLDNNKKIPLFVIYHPAYLLRSPREKSKAYSDLLFIRKFLLNPNNNF